MGCLLKLAMEHIGFEVAQPDRTARLRTVISGNSKFETRMMILAIATATKLPGTTSASQLPTWSSTTVSSLVVS